MKFFAHTPSLLNRTTEIATYVHAHMRYITCDFVLPALVVTLRENRGGLQPPQPPSLDLPLSAGVADLAARACTTIFKTPKINFRKCYEYFTDICTPQNNPL